MIIALQQIRKFKVRFLVIALGLDTARGDPTGTWLFSAKDFETNGHLVGSLHLPTLVVQEGGYNNRNLGTNARHFFDGFWNGMFNRTPHLPHSIRSNIK